MKKIFGIFLFLPAFAQAFTASDLKMTLNDQNVKKALGDSHISEITSAPCNRMRGSFCIDIKLENEKTLNVQGNNLFKNIEIFESSDEE